MNKRLLMSMVALLVVAGMSLAAEKGKEGSWTGWVTDTHCGAKGDNAKHADCAKKCASGMGAKLALYNPADKKVYTLDPQDKATGHVGQNVTVKGSVSGDTITITSIEAAPSEKKKGEATPSAPPAKPMTH